MKTITKTATTILLVGALTHLTSCTSETDSLIENSMSTQPEFDEQTAMSKFSEILSQATYANVELRQFLKEEALKQFDKNYDVLYAKVKDSEVGNNTFQGILEKYSTHGVLEAIFRAVPTLNIYVPKISMFDVSADNLDVNDSEIPVVNPCDSVNILYLNGEIVDSIHAGNVPAFHIFVVNNNNRVVVNHMTRSNGCSYAFIDNEFDGEATMSVTRSAVIGSSMIGTKSVAAYNYFNKDDGSNQSMALQRDYIYYGMTPTATTGLLNRSVTEYITFIEVDPKAYFGMTDKKATFPLTDDPEILRNSISRKKRDFTKEELINEFWTKGAYNIRVEMLLSKSRDPYIKYISVRPDDIWDFNYNRSYKHSTAFRHSKYTYTIDPNKFTTKRYDLSTKDLDFEKWDLAEEALTREVHFYEEDPGDTVDKTYKLDVTKVTTSKVSGNTKFGLGLGKANINIEIGGEGTTSTTVHESTEISTKIKNGDDNLGMAKIYFYDPLVLGKSGNEYIVKTYNTGFITFGITAK